MLYHPTSLTVPNWSVILGIAVARIDESSAARKMLKMRPIVSITKRNPAGYCSVGCREEASLSVLAFAVGCSSMAKLGGVEASIVKEVGKTGRKECRTVTISGQVHRYHLNRAVPPCLLSNLSQVLKSLVFQPANLH